MHSFAVLINDYAFIECSYLVDISIASNVTK